MSLVRELSREGAYQVISFSGTFEGAYSSRIFHHLGTFHSMGTF
jgi:hypothetical protein